MRILNFLKRKKAEVQKDNVLEEMLKDGSYKQLYKDFFEAFMHTEVIILGVPLDQRKVSLETTPPIEGIQFAYVYTSEQALSQVLSQKSLPSENFLGVSGKAAIQMFLEAGVGMRINAELPEHVAFTPGNLRFIASEMKISQNHPNL